MSVTSTTTRTPQGAALVPVVQRVTGATTVTITLDNPLVDGLEQVVKNGAELTRTTDYVLSGTVLTLTLAAIAGDVFTIRGYVRPTR